MSTPGNTAVSTEPAGVPASLLFLQGEVKKSILMMLTRIEAGMSLQCAVQDVLRELDAAYKAACNLEGVPALNNNLDPCSVGLQARFALDAAMTALKGGCDEHAARTAFWAIMRKSTTPSLAV